jgi:hypothetical protein
MCLCASKEEIVSVCVVKNHECVVNIYKYMFMYVSLLT